MSEIFIYGLCFEIPFIKMGKLREFIEKQNKLKFFTDSWDLAFVGLEWLSISDNETIKEFKDKVENAVLEIPYNCFVDNELPNLSNVQPYVVMQK